MNQRQCAIGVICQTGIVAVDVQKYVIAIVIGRWKFRITPRVGLSIAGKSQCVQRSHIACAKTL
jgi:hypothetical protein